MRLPLRHLLAYAGPAIPLAALTLPLYIIVPTFYSETLGVPLAAVGAALLLVRIVDALSDPVIGWLSDRTRTRFGRRRTLFLASLPLTAAAGLMLFSPPAGAGAGYLALWGVVLSIGYTATLIAYAAWGAELAADYHERSRVAAFREAFTLGGSIIAIAVPFAIGFDQVDGAHGLAVLGIVVALSLIGLGALATALVPEPVEHTVATAGLRAGLSQMVANRPFVRLIAAFLVNGLANAIPATLFLYFVSERLAAPEMRGPLLLLYFAAGVAGAPLALWAAGRIGKHRAWCWAMLVTCAVFAVAPLLGEGDGAAFAFISVLTGLALGFDLVLPASIQADVVDVDTAAFGIQRTGFYFAAWSLATKLALALAVGVAFPLLAVFGFSPAGENGPGALTALAVLYAWVPVVLKLGAIALMWNFPLDSAEQQRLRTAIDGRVSGRA
jgi:GPH family glycoside/pentoside/hexuronide:cation symporter